MKMGEKIKVELESEDFASRPLSYDRDNEEIAVEFSFYVVMSLDDARILGAMPRYRNVSIGDYFNSVRGSAFRDKWKITVELKNDLRKRRNG